MDEPRHPDPPSNKPSLNRQNENENDRTEEKILRSILNVLLYMVTLETRQLASQHLNTVLPQEGKEVPSEFKGLKKGFESLLDSIKTLDIKNLPMEALDRTLEHLTSLQDKIEIEIEKEVEPEALEPKLAYFSVLNEPDDLWGIIKRCDELFSRYSHLSHLALPFFWREAITELHKYNTSDTILAQRVIELPAIEIETISGKLLREAPCSGLLQVLKKRFESSLEMSRGVLVLPEDQNNIKDAVRDYIEKIEKFQEGTVSIEDLRRKAEYDLKNFAFGGGDMESRILKVAYEVANNVFRSATSLPPGDERFPFRMNTISLIVALNQIIVESSNLSRLLKELKF
ncbi:MAG: hypothetical protein ACFFGZ_00170 [Candidatus Thorarchaeota archaeon]